MSSSTLVNVAEDAENRLVALLAPSGRPTFVQDCEQCLLNGDAAGLLKVIISDQGAMNQLLKGEEAAFSLLAALLERVAAPDQEAQLADALANAVETQLTNPDQKIRLLSALYNLRSRPHEKCALLVRMIQLAPSLNGRLEELVDDVVLLLDGWSVPPEARRPLYRAIAQKDGSRKQKFTLLLVETYNEAVSSKTLIPFHVSILSCFTHTFLPSRSRKIVSTRQGSTRGIQGSCYWRHLRPRHSVSRATEHVEQSRSASACYQC